MDHDAHSEQDARAHGMAVEDCENRPKDEHRRDGTRVKVLVENVERGARDRKGEERADKGDACPLSSRSRKASSRQGPASQQQKKSREALAEQLGKRNGDMREVDPRSHDPVKNTSLHLPCEQLEVVGIERRMQAPLDRGEIDRIIFDAGVVSFDDESRSA
jgi:hypothetical protein